MTEASDADPATPETGAFRGPRRLARLGLGRAAQAAQAAQAAAARKPDPAALRRALREVAARAGATDAADFARDLKISFDEPSRARGQAPIAQRRGRAIERAAIGALGGLCLAAAAMLAIAPSSTLQEVRPLAEAPIDRLEAEAAGAFGTASTPSDPDIISGGALTALLTERPIFCVAPAAARDLGAGRPLASGCVEETVYDPAGGAFTRRVAIEGGGVLEINGAFSVIGGALCHRSGGVTAHLVGGDLPAARARSVETLAEGVARGSGAALNCARLRRVSREPERFMLVSLSGVEISAAPFAIRAATPQ